MTKTQSPKPFIKFAGGKTQLLPELIARLPPVCRTYYEPFVGGGALFFALAERSAFKLALLNDVNKELVAAYRAVAHHREQLAERLLRHQHEYKKNPEEFYYTLREADPDSLTLLARAARFIFLNKAGFNGLYRVNRQGKFNVPWGKRPEVKAFDPDVLLADQRALANATITNSDFSEVAEGAGPGDVVYFDPPYLPKSKTANFTSYAKGGFPLDDHRRLANVAKAAAERGAYVVISNSDMPEVREIFSDFVCHEVVAGRAINRNGEKRGKIWELIFVAHPRG